MFLPPRISSRDLGELSHRLAVETESGIDIRRTWKRESDSARPKYRDDFRHISEAVNRGDSLSVAIAGTGQLFPPLFREIVDVGEKTGTLGRVFHRLSSHYRKSVEMQRLFLLSILWPAIQLGLAICVIGALIWILGIIANRNGGQAIDILGFGLIGNRGLLIYTNFIIAVGLCIAGLVIAFRRGALWIKPLQHLVMKIPGLGHSLETLALARLTWALHLTMNVEMDLRKLVPLVLRATGNDYYIQHTAEATRMVATGHPIHEAFAATRAFPPDFIDALEVAEESGAVVESMERLSKRYEEESHSAVKMLTIFASVVVWLMVMGLITVLIFRLFGFYMGTINDALNMTR